MNEKCYICKNTINNYKKKILYLPHAEEKIICSMCMQQLENISNNEIDDYFYTEAKIYFSDIIENSNDENVKNLINDYYNGNIRLNNNNNYYSNGSDNNIWIKSNKIFAFLIFGIIIIIGIILGVFIGDAVNGISGFLIFLLSIPIAFFSISGFMIYLNMASDIAEIRNIFSSKQVK